MKPWHFDRCGGHLAIDFANTLSSRHTNLPVEHITSYDDLLAFASQCGVIAPAHMADLHKRALRSGDTPALVHARGVALREALYGVFAAIATKRPLAAADLEVLNTQIARLALDRNLHWTWTADPSGLDAPLGPIVRAAVDLLTSEERHRVRMCGADDCVWLFLDTSKNQSRRWCDMKQCGNRAKARRFYARQRKGA